MGGQGSDGVSDTDATDRAVDDLDRLAAIVSMLALDDSPRPMTGHAEHVHAITAAIKALTVARDRHVTRLADAARALPRKFDMPTRWGLAVIACGSPTRRRAVKTGELLDALDRFADTPAHRVNPITGEALSRAQARLGLRQRCGSWSPKWGEIEALGLVPADWCEETIEETVTISTDETKGRPITVVKGG